MIILSFRAASPTALPYHKTSFLLNFTAVNFTAVAKLAKRTEFARENKKEKSDENLDTFQIIDSFVISLETRYCFCGTSKEITAGQKEEKRITENGIV